MDDGKFYEWESRTGVKSADLPGVHHRKWDLGEDEPPKFRPSEMGAMSYLSVKKLRSRVGVHR